MVRGSRKLPRSGLALAVYLVCTAIVCSFILFDVLDVDGSDFPSRPVTLMTSSVAEDGHDVKRAFLKACAPLWVEASLVQTEASAESVGCQYPAVLAAPLSLFLRAHGYRVPLPRASLPDASPSA